MLWESGGAPVRRLAIGPGDVVLDVGCGTGNLAVRAAEVTGLDLTMEMGSISFAFASVEEAVSVYTSEFGPLVAARPILEASGRWQGLVAEIDAFFGRRSGGDGRVVMTSTYMTVLGHAPG